MSTVTIKVDHRTKVAMEYFGAKHFAETGEKLTNASIIRMALKLADEETFENAMRAVGKDSDEDRE